MHRYAAAAIVYEIIFDLILYIIPHKMYNFRYYFDVQLKIYTIIKKYYFKFYNLLFKKKTTQCCSATFIFRKKTLFKELRGRPSIQYIQITPFQAEKNRGLYTQEILVIAFIIILLH